MIVGKGLKKGSRADTYDTAHKLKCLVDACVKGLYKSISNPEVGRQFAIFE